MTDMVPFRPRQPLDPAPHGRPSWEKLTDELRGPRTPATISKKSSSRWTSCSTTSVRHLTHGPIPSRWTIRSRVAGTNFALTRAATTCGGIVRRCSLPTHDPRRRPKMGDFLNRLALDALPGGASPGGRPGLGDAADRLRNQTGRRSAGKPRVVQFIARRDEDTREVRAHEQRGVAQPGLVAPENRAVGTPPASARPRARQALQRQAATIHGVGSGLLRPQPGILAS